jgi:hypothetical protein
VFHQPGAARSAWIHPQRCDHLDDGVDQQLRLFEAAYVQTALRSAPAFSHWHEAPAALATAYRGSGR